MQRPPPPAVRVASPRLAASSAVVFMPSLATLCAVDAREMMRSPSPVTTSSSSDEFNESACGSALVASRRRATIRMSFLLNPSDEDEPDPEEAQTTQPVEVPKKRGRKPFLPKMNNSERGKYYRAKRKAYSSELMQEVDVLRATVARLTALRGICNELAVCPRATHSGSLVKLVREYFVQFRYGVQLPPMHRNMALPDVETSTHHQQVFMRATMHPELCFGEFKGIDVVMDQWERYSKYHAFLQFELLDLRVNESEDGGHIVETVGQLRTRYSRHTIENVFPHVVGNEPLIQRLIGKEVVYPCRNQFYFNTEGRVQRYDVEADFPEALQAAIGNLADVAILLGQALIKQQHMMGELDGEEKAVIKRLEMAACSDWDDAQSPRMGVDYLLSDDSACSDS